MGRRVDPARQARDDGDRRIAREFGRECLRQAPAACRRVARPDDGDAGPAQIRGIAPHGEDRRRIFDGREGVREVSFAEGDASCVEFDEAIQLGVGILDPGRIECPSPATAGEVRQSINRARRGPEMLEQLPLGDRADILRSDQAQPVPTFDIEDVRVVHTREHELRK